MIHASPFLRYTLCLIFTFIFLSEGYAQSIRQYQKNFFGAGIPTEEFEFLAAPSQSGRQRQENWCWAACIQMVLNYHGLKVSQEEVVRRIYGSLVDRPGNPDQVLSALSGSAVNTRGGYSRIYADYGFISDYEIINNLAAKMPIMVGLQNPDQESAHAYVLTAAYYHLNVHDRPVIDKVVLRDPYPTRPSRQVITWSNFVSHKPIFFKVWVQEEPQAPVLQYGMD
ncbi:MAG: papain-like cysteine protease family protein [Bacteroidota bacterium]